MTEKGIPPILNPDQKTAVNLLEKHKELLLTGGPGTGKTFVTLAAAQIIKRRHPHTKFIAMRPPIPTQDMSMGFIPGDLNEKMAPWFAHIHKMNKDNKFGLEIETLPIEHVQGHTFTNCVVLVDEVQNLPLLALKSILTRQGEGSYLVLAGDLAQCNLQAKGKYAPPVENLRDIMHGFRWHIEMKQNMRGERCAYWSELFDKRENPPSDIQMFDSSTELPPEHRTRALPSENPYPYMKG